MNIEYFMKIEIKHEISKVSGKQGSKRKGRNPYFWMDCCHLG